jgi:hypothetical protein
MANSFEAELEALVSKCARDLAEEVTALILGRLGIERDAARGLSSRSGRPAAVRIPPPRRASPPSRPRNGAPRKRTRSSSEQRAASLDQVAKIVSASGGLSVSEIERQAGLSRTAVGAALKALKDDKRDFMGGTKRFARYAASQAAADKASLDARRGAP